MNRYQRLAEYIAEQVIELDMTDGEHGIHYELICFPPNRYAPLKPLVDAYLTKYNRADLIQDKKNK